MNRKIFELVFFIIIISLVIARVVFHAIPAYIPFAAVGVYFFVKYFVIRDPDTGEEKEEK